MRDVTHRRMTRFTPVASQAGKGPQWVRILQRGQERQPPVFHASRRPVDLKDKWRNVVTQFQKHPQGLLYSTKCVGTPANHTQHVWQGPGAPHRRRGC